MSCFGLIEENMKLSHIHLAVNIRSGVPGPVKCVHARVSAHLTWMVMLVAHTKTKMGNSCLHDNVVPVVKFSVI